MITKYILAVGAAVAICASIGNLNGHIMSDHERATYMAYVKEDAFANGAHSIADSDAQVWAQESGAPKRIYHNADLSRHWLARRFHIPW